MFSQVSVCPNRGCTYPAGECTCLGVGSRQVPLPRVGTPPWAGTHPQEGTHSWAGTPLRQVPPGQGSPRQVPPATVYAGI